jgi:hypothetical protein
MAVKPLLVCSKVEEELIANILHTTFLSIRAEKILFFWNEKSRFWIGNRYVSRLLWHVELSKFDTILTIAWGIRSNHKTGGSKKSCRGVVDARREHLLRHNPSHRRTYGGTEFFFAQTYFFELGSVERVKKVTETIFQKIWLIHALSTVLLGFTR